MILDTIIASNRALVAERKQTVPVEALRAHIAAAPPPVDLRACLRRPGVSIIAEVKRASPSKGALNLDLDPATLVRSYADAGAEAVSVLTEPLRFRGQLEDLAKARQTLNGRACAILRKDFIIDPYQLLEARAWGADAVLLIAAALDDEAFGRLFALALALGLTPLVEVHSREEIERVLPFNPPVIGINNRNLHTFDVDFATTERLRPFVPPSHLVVSESGIHETEQMRALARLGIDGVLVGEALVRAPDPAQRLRELKEAGA